MHILMRLRVHQYQVRKGPQANLTRPKAMKTVTGGVTQEGESHSADTAMEGVTQEGGESDTER